ncbi:ABC transporter substrate-binding protein [Nakamurella sp.]|uniref:ABC transporter substrate-binding protein n=1 Tax=Nakamurella sp. TaxID=1869182 RepID=UPI003782D683
METLTRRPFPIRRRAARITGTLTAAVLLAGCANPDATSSSTSGSGGGSAAKTSLVLSDGYDTATWNPLNGDADYTSKVYDGLLRLAPADGGEPTFVPNLATALPQANGDATRWTVTLREGVTFHDGSPLTAADVAATYTTAIDPAAAAPVASMYDMLERVEATDDRTVVFDLNEPYAAFPSKLLMGIAPAAALQPVVPVEQSPLNTAPIGTGPYRLVSTGPDRTVLQAFDGYWGGPVPVREITIVNVTDDNTRVQRMLAGDFDGTVIPPQLAAGFPESAGFTVISNPSADWRSVVLPAKDPVAGDPAVRQALNRAVDRTAIVQTVLAGHGIAASTPFSPIFSTYYDPAAEFTYDPDAARTILDQAGWVPGPDGIRVKDGQRAEFTLMYYAPETLRRDLATAFAGDALTIGISVRLDGLGSWDDIQPRLGTDAVIWGGGDTPYDPDSNLYRMLSSTFAGQPGSYDNPGQYVDPTVDALLAQGRNTLDPAARAQLYRQVQQAYVADPAFVVLAFIDHVYVTRKDTGWTGTTPILEPHAHGVLSWGPWWNITDWTPA